MHRVLTGDFNHETNTFSRHATGLAEFESYLSLFGEAVPAEMRGTNTEQAGFMDCAERFGWQLAFTVAASANPGGLVTDEAYDRYAGAILDAARSEGPFDGIALSLHGAMVTESHDDAEGALLAQLREIVGPEVPIAVTLDLHANVSPEMARLADILVSYKTYPHVDMRVAGVHAGTILERAMAGEIAPRTAWRQPPQIEGLDAGRTDTEPMLTLLKRMAEMEAAPGIEAASLNAGFGLADTPHVGPTATVTYDARQAEAPAEAAADELAQAIWESRDVVSNVFLTPEEAAALARDFAPGESAGNGKALVVADFSDNPGAGSYGDATSLLAALLEAGVEDACFGALYDPEAAAALHAAGTGAEVTLAIGGKSDPGMGGGPLTVTGRVLGCFDGRFTYEGPMYDGLHQSLGPTAVLRVNGIEVLIGSHNMQMLDRAMFRAFGVEPAAKRVVVVKSMQHFRGAFEPLAAKVVVCDSGALARPRRGSLPFKKVRRPVYPLDAVRY